MEHELLAIIAPGLESEVIQEWEKKKEALDAYGNGCQAISEKGLVRFKFKELIYFKMIQILRSPTKFLYELDHFKCRDLPKLNHKLNKVPWEKVIYSSHIKFKISTKKSRLINTSKIERTCQDTLKKWILKNPRPKFNDENATEPQTIIIRIISDEVSVKIDCSGDPNYKRGIRKTAAIAPLRENYAYILGQRLCSKINEENDLVIDPMCGSGTILSEFLLQNYYNDNRTFCFQHFPLLKGIKKIKKHVPEIYTNRILGIDKNKFLKNFHKENFSEFENISFKYKDFFALSLADFPEGRRHLVCNLPYGKRIKTHTNINDFYKKFIRHSFLRLEVSSLSILIPHSNAIALKLSPELTFSNGGILVSWCYMDASFYTNTGSMWD